MNRFGEKFHLSEEHPEEGYYFVSWEPTNAQDRQVLTMLALMRDVCGLTYTESLRLIAEAGRNHEMPF